MADTLELCAMQPVTEGGSVVIAHFSRGLADHEVRALHYALHQFAGEMMPRGKSPVAEAREAIAASPRLALVIDNTKASA